MGLFSSKKTIVVSSTAYNMAGPELSRPNFLRSTVFSAVMNSSNVYLGEVIVSNYLTGPGIGQRNFFNWAVQTSYPGLPTLSVSQARSVNPLAVKPFIPVPGSPSGLVTEVQTATISDGDYSYFAEQYVLNNHPALAGTGYISEYDSVAHTITIQYVDGTVDIIPGGIYDPNKMFLTANYYHQIPSSLEPVIVGPVTSNVTNPALLPSTVGYTLNSTTNTGIVGHTLNYTQTVLKTYSNGAPNVGPTVTAPVDNIPFNGTLKEYSNVVVQGGDGVSQQTVSRLYTHHLYERRSVYVTTTTTVVVNNLGGGSTETVTTTKTGDHLRPIYDWSTDTQDTILTKVIGGPKMFIYEMGTGIAALDGLFIPMAVPPSPEFYPFLPIRLNNKSINHVDYSATGNGLYALTNTAYRKASGGGEQFSALVSKVENNPNLAEIDYAYVQYGVSLNVIEPACRKYLYQFFKGMIPYQNTSSAYMNAFANDVAAYNNNVTTLNAWTAAQNVPANPLYNTPRPNIPSLVQPETTTLKLKTNNASLTEFDNRISWVSIDEALFPGLGKPGALKDDIWIEKSSVLSWSETTGIPTQLGSSVSAVTNSIEKIKIFWQTDTNNYKVLTIYGLVHNNFIYGGKAVTITAYQAIDDPDPSGFLVPLHQPTVQALGLKDSTQMATANTFIVFNSYQIFKKKWYQSFFGMLLIIIAIVVIATLASPSAVGGITGALGTNSAVGASFGLTGTAAAVAGAVTNALAAIVISRATASVSTAVFGDKWGALISSLVTFALSGGLSTTSLMTPHGLLGLSSALANGYSGYASGYIKETSSTMGKNQTAFDSKIKEITNKTNALIGSNGLYFDAMQLTDTVSGNGQDSSGRSYVPETLDEFIHRTTLTGSDIADISLAVVRDYAKLSLELPR